MSNEPPITREQFEAWHHSPPLGIKVENGNLLGDQDEWMTVVEIFRLREDGASYAEIAREVDTSKSTVHRVIERSDAYVWFYQACKRESKND